MATVRARIPTEVYLQCPLWDCAGNEQVKVDGWVEENVRTRRELMADESGDDRSTMVYGTDEAVECPFCEERGRRTVRMIVPDVRPQYARQIQDPQGLGQDFLKALKDGRIKPKSEDSGEVEAMRRELAELKGFMAGQSQKRRPGRPPKEQPEVKED